MTTALASPETDHDQASRDPVRRHRRAAVNKQLARLLLVLAILAAWQYAGQSETIARGAVPTPGEVLASLRSDWRDYLPHARATLMSAGWGFLIGNTIGALFALLFLMVPRLADMLRGLLIATFCMPIAVLAPLFGVMLEMQTAKIVMASLWAIFTMQVSFLLAMRQLPPGALTVVAAAGGGRWRQVVLVHLRAGLPGFLAALQISAPSTVLAATLGDFIGGQVGLGAYLTGLVTTGSQSRVWAFCIFVAAICATLYYVFGLLRARVTGADVNLAIAETLLPESGTTRTDRSVPRRVLVSVVNGTCSLVTLLAVWSLFVSSVNLPSVIANRPTDVLATFTGDRGPTVISDLASALSSSLPLALLGVSCGLALALLFGVVSSLAPWFSEVVLPFTMVTQSVPMVAFAPILALIFGRGGTTIVVVVVLVTFFPAFVSISAGLSLAPVAPALVFRSVNAGPLTVIRMYAIPQAMPYLLAAARLVVPQAILGVVLAEQLVTGTGVGRLMSQSRGYQDFPMMWATAVVIVAVSVLAYFLVEIVERSILSRRSR
jgi:ABC-type nitrate/sulfonate/bicarbonate transport system permease component